MLGIEAEQDKPYAELWIGTHPKLPSEIINENKRTPLTEFIKNSPVDVLGKRVAEKFNNNLPFLLKVLSIEKALSIQAHPDKLLAKKLHKKDSLNYPDDNHKPEIAIAIDKLTAIVGLKPFYEIQQTVEKYTELKLLLGKDIITDFMRLKNGDEDKIKIFYSKIMTAPKDRLNNCIEALVNRFGNTESLTKAEEEFLIQYKNFGVDIGLISLLLFNYLELHSNQAIFTPAGIPHAYLKGNLIECMANSDNVVRAGLTTKFKDVETLIDMLEVNSDKSEVKIVKENNFTFYKTEAEEFEVCSLELNNEFPFAEFKNNEIKIFLVLEGEVEVSFNNDDKTVFKKGESFLIPAALNYFKLNKNENAKLFFVKVP